MHDPQIPFIARADQAQKALTARCALRTGAGPKRVAVLPGRHPDYIAAGLTKFVIRPAGGSSAEAFLDRFAKELLPRQN